MSISFTKLGKFSFTIFSNRFPFFCSLSSSSGTPMIQMLEPLRLSHKLLTLSLFYSSWYSFLNKDFIYLLLERGEGREKETKMSTCGCLSYAGATGDLARSPGLCPDWELNWQPFSLQARTQCTEAHQPTQLSKFIFLNIILLLQTSKYMFYSLTTKLHLLAKN